MGRLVTLGFGQQDYGLIIAGAILFALLAMLTEATLVLLTWAVTPGHGRRLSACITAASITCATALPTPLTTPRI